MGVDKMRVDEMGTYRSNSAQISSNYDNNIVCILLHLLLFNVCPGNVLKIFAPKVWPPLGLV